MKKLFFVLSIIISVSQVHAQDIPENAIGIRLSEGFIGDEGFGPEITYQRPILSEHNRFDASLGFKTNSFIATYRGAVYLHWTYNIWDKLNWFAGPGVGAGYVDFKTVNFGLDRVDRDGEFFPFIGADFGVDYRFDFPLQVAFSIRPTFDIHDIDRTNDGRIKDVDNVGASVGVSARYTF